MEHVGRACDAPLDICMTFGSTARSLVKHGHARAVSPGEGLELLQQAQDRGLVQFGENVREKPAFICNCCGCCCEAMLAAQRFGFLHPVHTTNFIAELDARGLQRLRQVREGLPGRGAAARPGQRPRAPRAQAGARRRRSSASAAACASAPARRARCASPRGASA